MRFLGIATGLALPLLWLWACSPLEPGSDVFGAAGSAGDGGGGAKPAGSSGGVSGGGVAGSGGGGTLGASDGGGTDSDAAGAAGATSGRCPTPEDRSLEVLGESGELTIDADTIWSCEHDYQLAGNVIVAPGAVLTIEAGTVIRAAPKVMLLIQRGARLEASGSEQLPITFTSAKAEGQRKPGDYRGVILIGDGPSQTTTTAVFDSLSDFRAHYGGGQAGDPNGSCGTLRYVRVEFAGGSTDDASLPAGALTLAACGAGTVVDYVQVHRAKDGIGLLGGTVPLRHLVVSNNQTGEAIEWSRGYTGTMQFVVAQSLGASAAMQGSNSADDPEASPVSRPVIYNATLVGRALFAMDFHYGLKLQLGSRVVFKNSVIQGFVDAAFDLALDPDVLQAQVGSGKSIDISHALMNDNARPYTERAQVLSAMDSMRMQDPGLTAALNPTEDMPQAVPIFAPADPTVNTQPAAVPAGFDATAGFRGGVPQDGIDWTLGWTSFPAD